MNEVKTFRAEVEQKIIRGDVTITNRLSGEMEVSGKIHGVAEYSGVYEEFLRIGGITYCADVFSRTFSSDQCNFGITGADLFISALSLLMTSVEEWSLRELSRQPDQLLKGQQYYHLKFRIEDMTSFVFVGRARRLGDVKISGRGELFVDQSTLLPGVLVLSCQSCYEPYIYERDLVLHYTLSRFDEPVRIPTPKDEPVLLPTPTGTPPPSA